MEQKVVAFQALEANVLQISQGKKTAGKEIRQEVKREDLFSSGEAWNRFLFLLCRDGDAGLMRTIFYYSIINKTPHFKKWHLLVKHERIHE